MMIGRPAKRRLVLIANRSSSFSGESLDSRLTGGGSEPAGFMSTENSKEAARVSGTDVERSDEEQDNIDEGSGEIGDGGGDDG